MMPDSTGKTNRDVRRFLRRRGVKPTAAKVDEVGREIRRTQQEHEDTQRIHQEIARELGHSGTVTRDGRDAHEAAREAVQRELRRRGK